MRYTHVLFFILMLAFNLSAAHGSQRLHPQAVEKATFSGKLPADDHASPLLVKLEVLLDRAHFSPGEIDGSQVRMSPKRSQPTAMRMVSPRALLSAKSLCRRCQRIHAPSSPNMF